MGLCERGTEGAVSFHLSPRNRPSIVPHERPGNPNPTENNRGNHGRSICTLATRLLSTGPPHPEKPRQRRPFSSPLTGQLRVQPDAVSILLSSSSSLSHSAPEKALPCRGIGGSPQQADFPFFAGAKIGEIAKRVPLCTARHY